MIKNRIEKNWKKLKQWSERHKIEAYRLYDRDIPEVPYMIDRYKDFFLVHDRTEAIDQGKDHEVKITSALKDLFNADPEKIIVKKRSIQTSSERTQKFDNTQSFFAVRETQAQFWVNLKDYLDTGLFLDHRPMRQTIFKAAPGKKILNLFSYTGSISVFAALGGAQTVSVDMSKTYLDWSVENFKLNNINISSHHFLNENVLKFIAHPGNFKDFDLIFLDPPTFSNSKKMDGTFEVERDQVELLQRTLDLLKPDGTLYFSTNKRKFKLDPLIENLCLVKDLTEETIPIDFHDKKIHRCFQITSKS